MSSLQWRPRVYTSAEEMLSEVRAIVVKDDRTAKAIAADTGVSPTTISNIISGKTRWPRQSTLFPLLNTLGYQLSIRRR